MRDVLKMARTFGELTLAEKSLFVKLVSRAISLERWEVLAETAAKARAREHHPKRFSIPAAERYMEQRLRKNMKITPRWVARECVYYKKVPASMMGYLVRAAQRIKKRLWMKRYRQERARAAV